MRVGENFDWIVSCYTETSRGFKISLEELRIKADNLKSKINIGLHPFIISYFLICTCSMKLVTYSIELRKFRSMNSVCRVGTFKVFSNFQETKVM